jgi:hypothetical protein
MKVGRSIVAAGAAVVLGGTGALVLPAVASASRGPLPRARMGHDFPFSRSARSSDQGSCDGCRPELVIPRADGGARVVRPEPRVLARGSGLSGGAS